MDDTVERLFQTIKFWILSLDEAKIITGNKC